MTALAAALAVGAGCVSPATLGALDVGGGSGGGSATNDGASTGLDDALPAWVPEPGFWAEISLNRLADVDPCPMNDCAYSGGGGQRGVLAQWSGNAFAFGEGELGSLVAWGGGGSGYWGNELYTYDLAARVWTRRTEPVDPPVVADPDNGEMADGSPVALNTFELVDYDPQANAFVVLRGQPTLETANLNGAGHLFDFDAGTWRRTALQPVTAMQGNSAYDEARGVFWASTQYGELWQYDPRGGPDAQGRYGRVTPYTARIQMSADTVAAIEPRHDVYVIADFREFDRVLGLDLQQPFAEEIELTTTGPIPPNSGGFVWVGAAQRFYWYAGEGNDIRTLAAPQPGVGDWRTDPWEWAQVEPRGGPTPGPRGVAVYGGWRWVPAIRSFVICNEVGAAVYAYRPVL